VIDAHDIERILNEFKRLRLTDETLPAQCGSESDQRYDQHVVLVRRDPRHTERSLPNATSSRRQDRPGYLAQLARGLQARGRAVTDERDWWTDPGLM